MKIIYITLSLFIISILFVSYEYRKEFYGMQQMLSIGNAINNRNIFTPQYKAAAPLQWKCINAYTLEKITAGRGLKTDADYILLLGQIMDEFSVQNGGYTQHADKLYYKMIINKPRPITLTFELVMVDNQVYINYIENICELFDYINYYFSIPEPEKTCR